MHVIAVLSKVGLTYLGAILLVLALIPIKQIIAGLPKSKLKQRWNVLLALIVFFIIGYVYYATSYWVDHDHNDGFDLLVPFIFLSGGLFVLLVGRLSLQTANDVKRIAVLEHESVTDPLMAIKNRRYFDQVLETEVNISSRYALALSLLMIDVDHFKKVNDDYGHLSGDDVLRNIAKAVRNIARDSDIVCRYGGEEIAVITPNTSSEQAVILAERLRSSIEHSVMGLSCANQEEIKVTISIGISSIDFDKVKSDKALIQRADQALYEAKANGRNQVKTFNNA